MTLLEAQDLSKQFVHGKKVIQAVNRVSMRLEKGQTLGLVGESGCGKSTLGQMLTKLVIPSSGKILFKGQDLLKMEKKELLAARKHLQMIFQDPYSSLNPRLSIAKILEEPFKIHKIALSDKEGKLEELLQVVGMDASYLKRYPHELSGGQRQRIGIARAIALSPECIICDEPVSALDISIQAQIIQLLKHLQYTFRLSYLFISHNLNVVRYISQRVAVMYLGTIVEEGSSEEIYETPRHPYTQGLLSAGRNPSHQKSIPLLQEPSTQLGCVFAARCSKATSLCKMVPPSNQEIAAGHFVKCHFPEK